MTFELRPTPRQLDVQPDMTLHQYITSQPFEEFLFSPETQTALDTRLEDVLDLTRCQEGVHRYMVRDVFATGQERFGKSTRLNSTYRQATLEAVQERLPRVPLQQKPPAYFSGLMSPNLENIPAAALWDNPLYGSGPAYEREISAKALLESITAIRKPSEYQRRVSRLGQGAVATFLAASSHATLQVMMRANGS